MIIQLVILDMEFIDFIVHFKTTLLIVSIKNFHFILQYFPFLQKILEVQLLSYRPRPVTVSFGLFATV